MYVYVFVWSEVHTCIWPSWCHCHSLSLASVKSRLVLPFWYRLTRVVPDKEPLNICVCVCVCVNQSSTDAAVRHCADDKDNRLWLWHKFSHVGELGVKWRRNLHTASWQVTLDRVLYHLVTQTTTSSSSWRVCPDWSEARKILFGVRKHGLGWGRVQNWVFPATVGVWGILERNLVKILYFGVFIGKKMSSSTPVETSASDYWGDGVDQRYNLNPHF